MAVMTPEFWRLLQTKALEANGLTQPTNDPMLEQILGASAPVSVMGGGAVVPATQNAPAPGEARAGTAPAAPTNWSAMSRDQKLDLMNTIAEKLFLGTSAISDFNLQPQEIRMPGGGGGGVSVQPYAPPMLGLGGIRG